MTKRKLALVIGVLALIAALAVVSVGAAFAQTTTPTTPTTPSQPNATQPNTTQPNTGKLGRGFGLGFGFSRGSMANFDAVAQALGISPTELFTELHSGQTLSQIAAAHGKTLADIQAAMQTAEVQAMKDRIQAAVTAGRISQDEANWLLQGLNNGYFGRGFGLGLEGRGRAPFGGMPGPRMRGFGNGNNGNNGSSGTQQPTPSTSSLGTSS